MTEDIDVPDPENITERFHTTQSNTEMFANITGDDNDLHLDEEAAKEGLFGDTVVHGVHALGYVSATIAHLPVDGDVILTSIDADFVEPIFHEETIVVDAYYNPDDIEHVTFTVWGEDDFENPDYHGPPRIGGVAEVVVK